MENLDKNLERRIKKHLKAPLLDFYAVVRPGFEEFAAQEIKELIDAQDFVLDTGGVSFKAKLEEMWLIHLKSFTLTSIRLRVGEFRGGTVGEIITKLKNLPWELYLPRGTNAEVSVKLKQCRIDDGVLLSNIAQREIFSTLENYYKKGMATADKKTTSSPKKKSPTKEISPPENQILLRGENNHFQVSLDCSGSRFFNHGYREAINWAPLRETTAALILRAAQHKNYSRLFDPMCGSGTFTLEGIATTWSILPGAGREFPFMAWSSFRQAAYRNLEKRQQELVSIPSTKTLFFPSDIDPKAIETTQINLKKLSSICNHDKTSTEQPPSHLNFSLEKKDFFDKEEWKKAKTDLKCLFLLNPPYGKRIKSNHALYKEIGKMLNTTLKECGVAIIVPGKEEEKALNLKIDKKILFFNGGIRCALLIRRGR